MIYYNPNERKRHKAVQKNREIRDNPTYSEEEWLALKYVLGWCMRCGSTTNLTKDHKKAIGIGGTNSLSNLTLLCNDCNRFKGSKTFPDSTPTYLLPSQETRLNSLPEQLKAKITEAVCGHSYHH